MLKNPINAMTKIAMPTSKQIPGTDQMNLTAIRGLKTFYIDYIWFVFFYKINLPGSDTVYI